MSDADYPASDDMKTLIEFTAQKACVAAAEEAMVGFCDAAKQTMVNPIDAARVAGVAAVWEYRRLLIEHFRAHPAEAPATEGSASDG